MQITLINHACVKLSLGGVTILCDPWLSGPAFNQGWDLLIKTPMSLDAVMEGVTHIWVSHEHPDHFVPKFFVDIAPRHGALPVLFQETRDKRIKSFLEARGFDVTELPDRREQTIGGVRIICGVSEFYDSWLHLADGTRIDPQSERLRRGRRGRAARDRAADRAGRRAAHPVQLRGLEGRTRRTRISAKPPPRASSR